MPNFRGNSPRNEQITALVSVTCSQQPIGTMQGLLRPLAGWAAQASPANATSPTGWTARIVRATLAASAVPPRLPSAGKPTNKGA
ncbi:hypothetical protein [Bacillus sp. 3255]|uniref:hypothetical protein n=1 Tax=Bacillus sp. 3255 TaxID=2817904 RepID=UPI0028607409|nr:hypothetical protein [Bacillus sp. 3255]MDR6880582.1 hypothetical protein [Bacillus sp. 3255]